MPSAEIIAIGTELLLGETGDTNTRYIARVLRGLGIDLYRTHTVGDNAARIALSVRESLARADIVITTGGLGPTVDDPTRQAIAEASGVELEFHPELWDQIVARIGRYGRTPTGNQKRQAFIPRGAIAIENPVGTAPAFIVVIPPADGHGERVVITLPGVPSEMETLLSDAVIPYLQKRYNLAEIIKVRTLHISGLGEGVIDDLIGDLEILTNPTVGLTAHSGVVDIRIATKAATEAEADSAIAAIETDLRSRMGDNLFGTDEQTLEGVTLSAISAHGWTLATVEAGLDGSLSRRLERAGASNYRGGRQLEDPLQTLRQPTEQAMKDLDANSGLALVLQESPAGPEIRMLLLHPLGEEDLVFHYGGHPRNAARWAVNNALDRLRRLAQKTV